MQTPLLLAVLWARWVEGGRTHNGFYTSSVAIINEAAASADPKLGDDNFPGYSQCCAAAGGPTRKTPAWIVNGDWLAPRGTGTTIAAQSCSMR